jgi:hypothetical protein
VNVKRIDIAEFRRLGLVQEINRRLLHPMGLALEVVVEADGTERLGGIWDYRDDPEGIAFGDAPDLDKAATVDALLAAKRRERKGRFGWHFQPPGAPMPEAAPIYDAYEPLTLVDTDDVWAFQHAGVTHVHVRCSGCGAFCPAPIALHHSDTECAEVRAAAVAKPGV